MTPELTCRMDLVGAFHVAADATHEDAIDNQKKARLRSIAPFWTHDRLKEDLLPFLHADAPLSLRHLDHLVQHYSRVKLLTYTWRGAIVRLHDVYRRWLKTWKRRLFDLFRRHQRVWFRVDDAWFSTTVAQLNWFFFGDLYGVVAYAREHRDAIDAHMRSWNHKRRESHRAGVPHRIPQAEDVSQLLHENCVFRF